MIDLKFGLFWSGAKLSYLRYLTFKTLRHFHPNSIIELYETDRCANDIKWNNEQQDFQDDIDITSYRDKLLDLGVIFKKFDKYPNYASNFQSDLFRWDWLNSNSGFYLDTDQIILKSFDSLPREYNFIYSEYPAKSCGVYTPVGVLGANKAEIVEWTNKLIPQFHNRNDYNSMGPWALRTMLRMRKWTDNMFNSPSNYFYPIPDSYLVPSLYNGSFYPNDDAFALHWFGGSKSSQEFNKKYTEELAKTSLDTISCILRDKGII